MNAKPDTSLKILSEITHQFDGYKSLINESDTRAKIIDKVLTLVLNWPEVNIRREIHGDSGRLDYRLELRNKPLIVVEAKQSGASFELPVDKCAKRYRINGSLTKNKEIKEAIFQARAYCDDNAARFGVATNGDCWIVFKAANAEKHWSEGDAIVFSSLREIQASYVQFYNLLSFDAISKGSLEAAFSAEIIKDRKYIKPIDLVVNSDSLLDRNKLGHLLRPYTKTVFSDIAIREDLNLFKGCYVYNEDTGKVYDDLDLIISDTVSPRLKGEGTVQIEQSSESSGVFQEMVHKDFSNSGGDLYLVLGGIGSGKSTFLKRYCYLSGKETLAAKTLYFEITFLYSDLNEDGIELKVYREVLDKIRGEYLSYEIESRKNIKTAFKDKIKSLQATKLRSLKKDSVEFETKVDEYLEFWQNDVVEYTSRLLKNFKASTGRAIVLFVDNVDQMSPSYQTKIYQLCQKIAKELSAVVVLALREDSFYNANQQAVFSAYPTKKFHISSPVFKVLIQNRINYLIDMVEEGGVGENADMPAVYGQNTSDLISFLRVVRSSILQHNRKLSNFVQSVSHGNMRLALQMFVDFMTSEATNVNKMVSIFKESGRYVVSLHEFLKSVMLGSHAFYKAVRSPVWNVFDISGGTNSSHFTGLRILMFLADRRRNYSPDGVGFVEIGLLIETLDSVFQNQQDLILTMNNMLFKNLIEVNGRSFDGVASARFVRITASGMVHLRDLYADFGYLDLVLQDTPVCDDTLAKDLASSLNVVNNISNFQYNKVYLVGKRFERVKKFIDYLAKQESDEHEIYNINQLPGLLGAKAVPHIKIKVLRQEQYIMSSMIRNQGLVVDV